MKAIPLYAKVLAVLCVVCIMGLCYATWRVSVLKRDQISNREKDKATAIRQADSLKQVILSIADKNLARLSDSLYNDLSAIDNKIKNVRYENSQLFKTYNSISVDRPDF